MTHQNDLLNLCEFFLDKRFLQNRNFFSNLLERLLFMSRFGEDDISEPVDWNDQEHAVAFDYLSRMPRYIVK
jgi:hypothetical protein